MEMKRSLFLACLGLALTAFGAPPTSVEGTKLRYSITGQRGFDAIGTEILLNQDGTYTGLRRFDWREMSVPGGTSGGVLQSVLVDISIPENGKWAYRLVDQVSAEIILDGRALRLHFTDGDLAGRLGDPIPNKLNNSFRFSSYEAATRMANSSTLAFVAPGRVVTMGFVITTGERRVLVRAIGPGLRTFGITQPMGNPRMAVFRVGGELPVDLGLPATSRQTLDVAAQRAGAFPLPSANDLGKYLTLTEGTYIVQVAAAGSTETGEILVEVYQLP